MTEAQDPPTGSAQQGSQAKQQHQPQDGGQEGQAPDGGPGTPPGEQMARKLVRDVAAFEVDPPPPARADPTPRDAPGPGAAE